MQRAHAAFQQVFNDVGVSLQQLRQLFHFLGCLEPGDVLATFINLSKHFGK